MWNHAPGNICGRQTLCTELCSQSLVLFLKHVEEPLMGRNFHWFITLLQLKLNATKRKTLRPWNGAEWSLPPFCLTEMLVVLTSTSGWFYFTIGYFVKYWKYSLMLLPSNNNLFIHVVLFFHLLSLHNNYEFFSWSIDYFMCPHCLILRTF